MKPVLLAVGLAVLAAVFVSHRASRVEESPLRNSLVAASSAAGVDAVGVKAVPIDYRNNGARTWCYLFNRSATNAVRLSTVFFLDGDGIWAPYLVYSGLEGEVIPPLGTTGFWVDDHVIPALGPKQGGSRENEPVVGPMRAVFVWEGADDDIELTAHYEALNPDGVYTREGITLRP